MPAEVIVTINLLDEAPDLNFQYREQQLLDDDTSEIKIELTHPLVSHQR